MGMVKGISLKTEATMTQVGVENKRSISTARMVGVRRWEKEGEEGGGLTLFRFNPNNERPYGSANLYF